MQLAFYIALFMNCYMLGWLTVVDVNKKNIAEICRDMFVITALNVFTFGVFLMFGQW